MIVLVVGVIVTVPAPMQSSTVHHFGPKSLTSPDVACGSVTAMARALESVTRDLASVVATV